MRVFTFTAFAVTRLVTVGLLGFVLFFPSTAALASDTNIIKTEIKRQGYYSVLGQSYANYLIGQYAITQGDIHTSAQELEKASISDPQNGALRDQAFLISLLDGNIEAAQRLNPKDKASSPTAMTMSALTEVVIALKSGRSTQAAPWLEKLLVLDPNDYAGQLLRPVIMAKRGQWDLALNDDNTGLTELEKSDPLLAYFMKAQKAKLLEIHGQTGDAESIYVDLVGQGPAAISIFGIDYGHFLERRGRKDEALKLYQEMLSYGDIEIERLNSKTYKKPAKHPWSRLYSDALYTASDIALNKGESEMALFYAQMSLWIDPAEDQRLISLGQAYTKLNDHIAAEAVWLRVPETSPFYLNARLNFIYSLKDRNEKNDAEAETLRLWQKFPANLDLMTERAYNLRANGQPGEALAHISQRVEIFGDKDFTWQTYLLLATLFDDMDQWDQALAAIEKALALNENRAEILNFLGYGLINRGVDVKKGMGYVRQALKLSPRSGAIIDSLGWGYFKSGDNAQALMFIEQAVQLQPADPEINEHLGDVYLAAGRRVEAEYAYRRALGLNPSKKAEASINSKLNQFK